MGHAEERGGPRVEVAGDAVGERARLLDVGGLGAEPHARAGQAAA
jgi:hypothetical protein